jgi:hypothetical protein
MRPPGRVVIAALFLAVALGSCSSTSSSGSNSSNNEAKKSFEISTPIGQVSLSLDGKLPPNWPANVPLPKDTTPAGSGSVVSEKNGGVMVGVYKSGTSPEEVYKFYATEPSITTESKAGIGSGSNFVGRLKISAPKSATVTTAPYSSGALIVVAIKTESGTAASGTSGRV